MNDISRRIEELIANSVLSYAEFAERIGISSATISHILKGRNKPSLQVITQIKKAFTNVNIDYLITGEGTLYIESEKTGNVTAVDTSLPSSFPMEGVRKVNVSGVPTKMSNVNLDNPEIVIKRVTEKIDQTDSSAQSEIEQVMIFYTDGRFKVYRP